MRRYLLVDDNVAFAQNLAEIIEDSGGQAVVADSGAQALEQVRRSRFDVVVSDMRMPVMNGAELVRHLRALDAGLPALIVSAYTADEELEQARQLGVFILPKPVPIPRLLGLSQAARRGGVVAIVARDQALGESLSGSLEEVGFASVLVGSFAELELEPVADVPFLAVVAADVRPEEAPTVPLVETSGSAELEEVLARLEALWRAACKRRTAEDRHEDIA
jgi:CheY-like chemotaxis protein